MIRFTAPFTQSVLRDLEKFKTGVNGTAGGMELLKLTNENGNNYFAANAYVSALEMIGNLLDRIEELEK